MSESRAPFTYIVMLTLMSAFALALSAIAAPCIEIGFFWVSIMMALAVSLYAWHHGERITQNSMLLVYCLLACSVSLAVTSLLDLANFTFLGKHRDAESGFLLGCMLAFCLLAIISARLSSLFPATLAWGALVASLMAWAYGSSYLTGLSPEHSVIVTVASILGCLVAFTALCHCKENLTDSQYLGVLSLIVVFIGMAGPGSKESLTASLLASLIHLLAGILFFSVRRDVPVIVRIGAVMWVFIGFTSIVQDVLSKVLNVNEIAAGVPSLLCSLLAVVWSRSHKEELPRGLYWVSLLTFGFLGIFSVTPEEFCEPLTNAIIGTVTLFVLVCIWFAPSPLLQMEITWRGRVRYAFAACGFIVAMSVTGIWFTMSIAMLSENTSPARLIAKLHKTPLWPGDKAYVRLAMRDESLWADDVRKDPPHDLKLDDYFKAIRPAGERFSYVSDTSDENNFDCGFNEGLGINWKRKKEHIAILQVNRNSSAGLAGLSRGESVLAINDVHVRDLKKLDDKGWDRLFGGWKIGAVVSLDVMASSGTKRKVTMTVGYDIQDPPMSRIITTPQGSRIGYLYLDSFNTAQFENIREHFSTFKKNGVYDLVLDLRYNSGGNLVNSWRLGNLLAGESHDGKQFLRLEHSPRYEDLDIEYKITKLPESMGTRRLVVLTTGETCSASETVINGLKPYLQVITVGSTTCGKPFSMSPIEFGENTLMPVTARVLNARGEGDFIKGLRPDCKVKDDPTHLLGDPQEGMLETAITFLDTGLCQASR